ncbi:MAG: GNAT family N-acetyltransferase [Hyphomicrobiaceae bacterium]|nr:GNAT family N-acetyltransferase [Hyphomicrobiaceae bacterium]
MPYDKSLRKMTDASRISLRPATDRDWSQIRRWLSLPEIERWWGPSAAAEAEVITALGSAHALTRMIVVDGQDVGYCHAVDAQIWGSELPAGLVAGTWDLDIFIGEASQRGGGVGLAALTLLRDEVFATTLAVAVSVFTSIENERAVRAFEKIGFKWQQIWDDPAMGPTWFMLYERPRR